MQKAFLIFLLFCSSCLFCTSCLNQKQEISVEQFEQQCLAYKTRIQNIDSSLKISTATHICQDGEHIVVYSIETISESCLGVTFTFISPDKTQILIEFNDAVNNWDDNNRNLLSTLIYQFTNNGFEIDEIEAVVDAMNDSDHYRFNSCSSLFWDDYHSTLYYTEALFNK